MNRPMATSRQTLNWLGNERALAADAFWWDREHASDTPDFFARWLERAITAWTGMTPQRRAAERENLPTRTGTRAINSYVLSENAKKALDAACREDAAAGQPRPSRARLGVEAALYRYAQLQSEIGAPLPDRSGDSLPRR